MKLLFYIYIVCFCILFCFCKRHADNNNEGPKSKLVTANYSCSTPETTDTLWYSSGKKAPIFKGLDGLHFAITTKNKEVQHYFNQGLMLSFGFNHAEAARSFFEATRQDPQCAMSWWGFAYVLGPNYNGGMEKDNFERAFDAVQKAKLLTSSSTEREKDLIEALSQRYSNDTTVVRAVLDAAYAVAMRKVYKKYPNDATIGSLFAESLMDMHPWNLWNKDGTAQPWTPEIMSVLEKCIQREPKHAGANHFYVHATEMSQHAEDAEASANLLRTLVPGSGHLVHMPAHTYIRIGRYHDGVVTNQKAVAIDSLYLEACHAQGAYPLGYYPHNYHFIAACATIAGESKAALDGAIKTANHAHKKLFRDPDWSTLQHYYSIPWYVEVKLGLWKDILQSKAPEKDLKYPMVVWHYAQGMAMLSQNKVADAKKHLDAMRKIMLDTKIKDLTIWEGNSVFDLCTIASKILEGEINAKEKNYTKAIALLKEAVAIEDALNYNEPPDWFFSVRHHLGAVLIDAGKYKDAIKIYEEDLKNYPKNGWALKGLMNVYEKLGDKNKYNETKSRFETAWKYADIKISSSRIL
ncbi:tetratricopeptide repeat protein [Flavobacterium luteum]|uniref:Tetratricopeptide repeat protein n=1 Tax=Flavobacterium luteum TaxID=2026654 RepID=A0A7J5AMB6_9FLAO|nr:tetratricopeptide repeat protein [Flavobacterium luteum]KAB1158129.1 tetratricopeptide repeat protein [Flavobacterium luteum]